MADWTRSVERRIARCRTWSWWGFGVAALLLAGCSPSPAPGHPKKPQTPVAGAPETVLSAATVAMPAAVRDERADADGGPLTPTALARVKSATVLVETRYRPIDSERAYVKDDQLLVMNGSGFVIGDEGIILTNAHCVQAVVTNGPAEDRRPHTADAALERAVYVLHSISVRTDSGSGRSKMLSMRRCSAPGLTLSIWLSSACDRRSRCRH